MDPSFRSFPRKRESSAVSGSPLSRGRADCFTSAQERNDMSKRKTLGELRSQRTFGATDLRSFGHRSRALQMGYAREDFLNKPVIAIINTWSDLAQCHSHFPNRVEEIKRGIWQAGGFPVELPAMSLSEQFV